jgi:hypothetical protein
MLAEKKRVESETKVTSFARTPVIQLSNYNVASPAAAYEMERDFQVMKTKYKTAEVIQEDDTISKPDVSIVEQCLLSVPYLSGLVAKERKGEIFNNTRQRAANELKKILGLKQKAEEQACKEYLAHLSLQIDLTNRLGLILENGLFDEDDEFEGTVDGTISIVDYHTLKAKLTIIIEETKELKEEYMKIQQERKETKVVMKRLLNASDRREYIQVLASCKHKLGLTETQLHNIADDTIDDARDFSALLEDLAETTEKAHIADESPYDDAESEADLLLSKFKKRALNRKKIQDLPAVSQTSNSKGPKPPPYDGMMLLSEEPKQVKHEIPEDEKEADLAVL